MHNYQNVIQNFGETNVLVVGDVMLDTYQHSRVDRISPEAPVPIALISYEESFLGGAGNVANNIRALGGNVSLVSVAGDDSEGDIIRALADREGIDADIVSVSGRVTTVKKRVVSGTQQLLRIDREETEDISIKTEMVLQSVLVERIQESDIVVISDYQKGLLTEALVSFVREVAHTSGKRVLVDSKSQYLARYTGVYLIKPNKSELERFSGEKIAQDYENLEEICRKTAVSLNTNLVATLGPDGIACIENQEFTHILPLETVQVFDVSGAGDTVLATLATAIAAGASVPDASRLATVAAGYVVSKLGTSVCTREVLQAKFPHI